MLEIKCCYKGSGMKISPNTLNETNRIATFWYVIIDNVCGVSINTKTHRKEIDLTRLLFGRGAANGVCVLIENKQGWVGLATKNF